MLKTLNHWRHGVRLYIALTVVAVTLETWWWAMASFGGTQLFATRMEEVFAWLALSMVTIAVSIGPVYKIWPLLWGKKIMFDARRLIGIGAAWFATLHAGIAYVSLFKIANPLTLPRTYQQSFTLAAVALVILLAMAGTSFDRAMRGMGIWWFRLHRFVYVALSVALLHAFLTGAHATAWLPLALLSIAALVLMGLHIYLAFIRTQEPSIWQILTIGLSFMLLLGIFDYGYSQRLGYNPLKGKGSQQHAATTPKS